MNTQILSKAAALNHVDHEAAHKRYRELLRRQSATAAEAKEMRDLLEVLGKPVTEAYEDVKTMKAAHELLERVERARGSETRLESILVEMEKCDKERNEAIAAFRSRRVALEIEQSQLSSLSSNARRAIFEMSELKASAGLILAEVANITEAEVNKSLTAPYPTREEAKPAAT